MADFLAEFIHKAREVEPEGQCEQPSDEPQGDWWTVYADRSSNQSTSGAGIILISPHGDSIEYALRFVFKATNNEAEYEVVVIGLQLCSEVGAQNVRVLSDSQLVISQCNGNTDTKNEQMKKYTALVTKLRANLARVEFKQVPREENQKADTLALLASKTDGHWFRRPRSSTWKPRAYRRTNRVKCMSLLSCAMVIFRQIEERQRRSGFERLDTSLGTTLSTSEDIPILTLGVSRMSRGNSSLAKSMRPGICGNHSSGRALAFKALQARYYL